MILPATAEDTSHCGRETVSVANGEPKSEAAWGEVTSAPGRTTMERINNLRTEIISDFWGFRTSPIDTASLIDKTSSHSEATEPPRVMSSR